MPEVEVDLSGNSCPALSAQQVSLTPPQSCSEPQNFILPQPSSSLSQLDTESSCMDIEAAQRKLQEIEDRYRSTLTACKIRLQTTVSKALFQIFKIAHLWIRYISSKNMLKGHIDLSDKRNVKPLTSNKH